MKPIFHAKISVKKWGGDIKDYIEIHKFLDSAKAHLPDVTHRVILHNTFGIFLAERIFGDAIVNSDDKTIAIRDIAENHILEDCGFIPTLQDWFAGYKLEDWMLSQNKGINRKEPPYQYEKISADYEEKKKSVEDEYPLFIKPQYQPLSKEDRYPWTKRVID